MSCARTAELVVPRCPTPHRMPHRLLPPHSLPGRPHRMPPTSFRPCRPSWVVRRRPTPCRMPRRRRPPYPLPGRPRRMPPTSFRPCRPSSVVPRRPTPCRMPRRRRPPHHSRASRAGCRQRASAPAARAGSYLDAQPRTGCLAHTNRHTHARAGRARCRQRASVSSRSPAQRGRVLAAASRPERGSIHDDRCYWRGSQRRCRPRRGPAPGPRAGCE